MGNICFLNGHLLNDINYFKKILNHAIQFPTGKEYCGILDLIWEGTLENWIRLEVDEQMFIDLIEICSNIRSRNITEYDGMCKISSLFDLRGNNTIQRSEYIRFEKSNLCIRGNADFQTVNSLESCEYKLKVDENWPIINVSTYCTIQKPIDHVFEFDFVIKNRESGVIVFKRKHSINPHNYFYNGEKTHSIEILLDEILDDGEYIIEFLDKEQVEKCAPIQSTSLKILKYNYDDCFELQSVDITGDSLYVHKTLQNTFFAIESSSEMVRISLKNEVKKQVNQKFPIKISFGDNIYNNIIDTDKESDFSLIIPIINLPVGIYQIKITTNEDSICISDSYSIFITGGKREIKVNEFLTLNFIEIVDKNKHYIIAESDLTEKEYNTIMEVENTESLLPHVFHYFNEVSALEQAKAFIVKAKHITGISNLDRVELEIWQHALDNGNIQNENVAIEDMAWYKDNSEAKLHPVKTKLCSVIGLYDLMGNIPALTSDKDVKVKEWRPWKSKFYLVGGNYLSSANELNIAKPVPAEDLKKYSFSIRLMANLPIIEDLRKERYSYDIDSSYESVDPTSAYFEREMRDVGALL